jgi:uncharacterized protein
MRPEAPLAYPVAGLLADVPGAARRYPIDEAELDLPEGLRLTDRLTGEAEVARTNRGVYVTARVHTAIAGECARCLREVSVPIDVDLAEEVLPSIDLATGAPVDAAAEPEVTRLDDHHRLDLGALVAEAISLAEPIAPLCEPACPGLCPDCGARLDAAHVAHVTDDVDPRLAALRGFRVDGDAENG